MSVTALQNTKISSPKHDYTLQNCTYIDDRLDQSFSCSFSRLTCIAHRLSIDYLAREGMEIALIN